MEYEIKVPGISSLMEEGCVGIHGENHMDSESAFVDFWEVQMMGRLYGHDYVQEGINKAIEGKKFDGMSPSEIFECIVDAVDAIRYGKNRVLEYLIMALPNEGSGKMRSWGYISKRAWEVPMWADRERLDCEWVSRRAGDIARMMG